MKRLLATIAIALFAASVGADDVYRGLAKGSPDLGEPHPDRAVAAQPGVNDMAVFESRTDTADLSPAARTRGAASRSGSITKEIYNGFCGDNAGNADLNC
ncbi:MAG: hypothetical protein IPN92_01605 [Chromatiaceae bacterium]|nr:hypothetical protein [Chromatiaceae bacterium]